MVFTPGPLGLRNEDFSNSSNTRISPSKNMGDSPIQPNSWPLWRRWEKSGGLFGNSVAY